MDPITYLIVFLVLAVLIVAKVLFRHTITFGEAALQGVITVGLTLLAASWMFFSNASDVEFLNGQVTGKYRDTVSCEHSYECRCKRVKNKDGTTSRVCDTCYEHSFDYDWILKSDVGRIEISRVDRQGVTEPMRYSQARNGDPVAQHHTYSNWVKAAEHSVFHHAPDPEEYKDQIPEYPIKVYDYHYADRVLAAGELKIPGLKAWNRDLAERLRTIGPKRQGNIVVVFTDVVAPSYADALERAWLRGKKNDTVVVIGADKSGTEIKWARGFGWSRDKMLYVRLRDDLQDYGLIDRDGVLDIVEAAVMDHFDRLPMAEFENLKSEISLTIGQRIFLTLLALGLSIGASIFFHRKQVL